MVLLCKCQQYAALDALWKACYLIHLQAGHLNPKHIGTQLTAALASKYPCVTNRSTPVQHVLLCSTNSCTAATNSQAMN
jgi:hypothetical protein